MGYGSTCNYRAWALAVLTTATETIIDLKGALIVVCLAECRFVMLASSMACYCIKPSATTAPDRDLDRMLIEESSYDHSLPIVEVMNDDHIMLNLKFIDRLLSSLLSVTKELYSSSAWIVATSLERTVDSIH